MEENEKYMKDALREAIQASAEDEVPIGAVIVCRGRIIGKESIGGGAPTEFAMYNADQYMKPEGAFTLETAKDGSKWYKQVPEDTVQKTPYMDSNGDVQYNESIVKQLPQIPRRKDRV